MNWMERLFGFSPQNKMLDVPQRPAGWTTPEELATARKYDQAYGDPASGFFQPGAKVRMPRNLMEMKSAFNNDTLQELGMTSVSPEMSDQLYSAWLAAQSSPTAAVGFDPRVLITAPRAMTANAPLNISGSYTPSTDTKFTTGQYDSTLVHESIHRGIQKLREADLLPANAKKYSEEMITRAFMQKYYGDVEKGRGAAGDKQVESGARMLKSSIDSKMLDDIESASAQLYAAKRPRGPR